MEENKYQRGKIYKIISPHTDKIYIGSTTEFYLGNRLAKHRNQFNEKKDDKYCSSFELLKLGDVEIILIETYSCNSKDELYKKEREYIELNKNIVVNINIPSRSKSEYHKEYVKTEKYKIYQKNYMDIYNKKYRDKNEDKLKEYEKNRPNKDERKEKYKLWSLLKYKCICGSEITNGNKSHHFDTDKHQTYELIQTL
jgi:broad specificity polyphosphatase/5'/3'-nucleotidase SurE